MIVLPAVFLGRSHTGEALPASARLAISQWRTTYIACFRLGLRAGFAPRQPSITSKINDLEAGRVGFQTLSLRQMLLRKLSVTEIAAAEIPSVCGLLRENVLAANLAKPLNSLARGSILSKAPDCPYLVRRHWAAEIMKFDFGLVALLRCHHFVGRRDRLRISGGSIANLIAYSCLGCRSRNPSGHDHQSYGARACPLYSAI